MPMAATSYAANDNGGVFVSEGSTAITTVNLFRYEYSITETTMTGLRDAYCLCLGLRDAHGLYESMNESMRRSSAANPSATTITTVALFTSFKLVEYCYF